MAATRDEAAGSPTLGSQWKATKPLEAEAAFASSNNPERVQNRA